MRNANKTVWAVVFAVVALLTGPRVPSYGQTTGATRRSGEPDQPRMYGLQQAEAVMRHAFNPSEMTLIRPAGWVLYTFCYDANGRITRIWLERTAGSTMPTLLEQRLRRIIQKHVYMYVPASMRASSAAARRTAGVSIPCHKLKPSSVK